MKTCLIGFVVATVGVYCATPAAVAASVDCSRASSNLEKMICGNAVLNQADERLAEAYKAASFSDSSGDGLKTEQSAWLKFRNGCGDQACLLSLYRNRIPVLAATSEPVASPTGRPLMVLPAKNYPSIEQVRESAASVVGTVAFGHDTAGEKYDMEGSSGGTITLSRVWDLTNQEQDTIKELEDKNVNVQVTGTLEIHSDGIASFSRRFPASIYQLTSPTQGDGSMHGNAPPGQVIKAQLGELTELASCVLNPNSLIQFDRVLYEHISLEVKRGNAMALYQMGMLCDPEKPLSRLMGMADPSVRRPDDAMAAAWYAKAAAQGDAMSQLNLCEMHRAGRGVSKNVEAAAEWCRKAAAQDIYRAEMILEEIEADNRRKQAELESENLRKRALQGESDAQNDLAVEYQRSEQYERAVALFRKAAAQGNKIAQFNMGITYEQGLGVPKDLDRAITWYLKSAEQGNADAQEKMGVFYAEGIGVAKDLSLAAEWNRKAGAQGKKVAQRAYEDYATDRTYDKMVAEVANRFDVPKSAYNICVAGVMREKGINATVPEFITMLAARETMLEKIVYSEPGLFGGDYTLSFKRRADQHDQVKRFTFRKIFVGDDGKIYVNQTPQGELKTCIVVSRIEYIGGRVQKTKENLEGMLAANVFVDGIRSKLRRKARETALGGN